MMMKKMLCVLLALLLCPMLTLAEESAAGMLTSQELAVWAESYIARARASELLNIPAEDQTPDGYAFIYDFATLYADTPTLDEDTTVSAIVLTSEEENGPRGVTVSDTLSAVLDAYYTENPTLLGTRESAVLYAVDRLPEGAAWGQVLRDGQRVKTVQYAVHEQLASRGEGLTDAGVIYTLAENRVAAVRVYGLNSRITREEANDLMYDIMLAALKKDYAQVPFSYDGAELTAFSVEDLLFSGIDFLALTPEKAIELLGTPLKDASLSNGSEGTLRVQSFSGCDLTWLVNPDCTETRLYMLAISNDSLEGPRAVRLGDTFSSVYNRFRNGEGRYQENGSEILYGTPGEGSFGQANYGNDASAILRYVIALEDGRRVTLQLSFTVMECTEIMLYAE